MSGILRMKEKIILAMNTIKPGYMSTSKHMIFDMFYVYSLTVIINRLIPNSMTFFVLMFHLSHLLYDQLS